MSILDYKPKKPWQRQTAIPTKIIDRMVMVNETDTEIFKLVSRELGKPGFIIRPNEYVDMENMNYSVYRCDRAGNIIPGDCHTKLFKGKNRDSFLKHHAGMHHAKSN